MNKTVLIVDDEEDARELLKIHLNRHPNLSVVGEAKNGKDALESIGSLRPDIVLLDIQMPELSGIEVVERLTEKPIIIFVTAYDAFAVKAFDLNAVDYLLKPINSERFDRTIEKALQVQHSQPFYQDLISSISDVVGNRSQYLHRFAYRDGLKTIYIQTKHVIMIESDDQYVNVFTSDNSYLLRLSMDYLESVLDPNIFFRSHRSYLVNIEQLTSVEQYEPRNFLIHLEGELQAKLSRERKEVLNTILLGNQRS